MPTTVNIDEVRQKISIINTQSAKVNNQRSVNLGKKQATESQLSALLKSYKEQYGVDLTPETLDTEVQSVVARHEEEYNKLSQVISAINAGNYGLANQLLGIEERKEESSEAVHLGVETLSSANDIMNGRVSDNANVAQPVPSVAQSVEAPVSEQASSNVISSQQTIGVATNDTTIGVTLEAPVVNEQPVASVPPVANVVTPPVGAVPPVANIGVVPVVANVSPAVSNAPRHTSNVVTPPVNVATPKLSGTEFMENVQDNNAKAPIAALEGFTKNGHVLSGIEEPNLDVAPSTNKPKSFSDIIGGSQFTNI